MEFPLLLNQIKNTHLQLQDSDAKAVNKLLTIRNWLVGFYIVEYEQKGEVRAQYGEKLLETLAKELRTEKISIRHLQVCRQFYILYPQIRQSLTAVLNNSQIAQSLIAQLQTSEYQTTAIPQSLIAESGPAGSSINKNH